MNDTSNISANPASKSLTQTPAVKWDITFKTLFKVLFFALGLLLIVKTFDLIILFFLGLLLAGSLFPVIHKLEKKRVPKVVSLSTVVVLIVAFVLTLALVVIPSVFTQTTDLLQRLPKLQTAVLEHVQPRSPFRPLVENMFKS